MKHKNLIIQRYKAWFMPYINTRFLFKAKRIDLIWVDKNKTQVKSVINENGRYIIGCDPAFIPNLWQKFWMSMGFYKKYKSHSSILRINEDGTLFHLKRTNK